jgi:hypothetical protein
VGKFQQYQLSWWEQVTFNEMMMLYHNKAQQARKFEDIKRAMKK